MVWWGVAQLHNFDLRFKQGSDEASFKVDLEHVLIRNSVIGYSILVASLLPLFVWFENMRNREDFPFQWSLNDPRTQYFAVRFAHLSLASILVLLGSLRCVVGLFKSWNWELIIIIVTSFGLVTNCLCSVWHVATQFDMDPEYVWESDVRYSELLTILGNDAVLTAACLFVPLRACVLWVLPISAVLPLMIVVFVIGTPFPDIVSQEIISYVSLALFSFVGASRQEASLREKWTAMRQVAESQEVVKQQELQLVGNAALARGMRSVATALCDLVVEITEDLRICKSGPMQYSFFGRDVEGVNLNDLLPKEDRMRFKTRLDQLSNSDTPVCIHTTLLRGTETFNAKLLLVDTHHTQPRYLIGVQCEDSEQFIEPGKNAPFVEPIDRKHASSAMSRSSSNSTGGASRRAGRHRTPCTTISEHSTDFGIDNRNLVLGRAMNSDMYLRELDLMCHAARCPVKDTVSVTML